MEKKLSEIIRSIEYTVTGPDGIPSAETGLDSCTISSLVFDSREVKEGSLFFALPGTHTTGNAFIHQTVEKGCSAVVFQDEFSEKEKELIGDACRKRGSAPVFIKVSSSRFAMSPVSAAFYDNPSEKLVVYGVTGTEGKSSTVSFLWQLLKKSGFRAGFISTVQYSLGDDAIDNPQHQTTPEAPIVQRQLYEMIQNGCTHAVVESSSHGLSKRTNRLGDVLFDCGIFMNVTLEHLEFHGTYEQYKSDKANLFRALTEHSHEKTIAGKKTKIPSLGIVNLEDPAAEYFAKAAEGQKVIGFTTSEEFRNKGIPAYSISNVESAKNGISFSVDGENLSCRIDAPVPGAFNAYNITAAVLAVSLTNGTSPEKTAALAETLDTVKGRMTVIDEGQEFEVIVDYAHTPSSFQTIFPPIRKRCSGKIICVFGSAGERDTTKRPLQGEIAAEYCDVIVLTDEDPRKEDGMEIIRQIAAGAEKKGKKADADMFMIPDRPKAIRKALSLAGKDDIVLLLGKSHENSIIYADHTMKYDEIAEARKALKELIG